MLPDSNGVAQRLLGARPGRLEFKEFSEYAPYGVYICISGTFLAKNPIRALRNVNSSDCEEDETPSFEAAPERLLHCSNEHERMTLRSNF